MQSRVSSAFAIAGIFTLLYAVSIGPAPANIHWFNFVFDADPSRVMRDAIAGQDPATFDRHPLFALIDGVPARLLRSAGVPNPTWLVVALFSGAGVGSAFLLFRRICGDARAAIAFASLYGCSSSIWLLSAIPETFALNAALFIVLLLAVDRGKLRQVASVASIGMAVPNGIYVLIANGWTLLRERWTVKRTLGVVGAMLLTYGAAGFVQALLIPGSRNVLLAPLRAVAGDPIVRDPTPMSPAIVGETVANFTVNNLVAPAAGTTVVSSPIGAMQMVQFIGPRWTQIVALIAVGACLWLVGTGGLRGAWQRAEFRIALLVIVVNIAGHLKYRANGQPVIFTAHTVAPAIIVLATMYGSSAFRHRLSILTVATIAVIVNNAVFVAEVRAALNAPCDERVGLVCVRWARADDAAKYNRGVPEFLASADYDFELAREALDKRDYDRAIPLLRRALARDSAHRMASQYLGFALLRSGRPGEALPWLTRARLERPRDAVIRSLAAEAEASSRLGNP